MYRQFCSLKGKLLRSNTDSVLPTSFGIVTRTIFTSSPGSVEDASSEYFGIAPAVLSPDLHLLLSLHAFSRLVRVGLGLFPPPFSTLHLWTIFYLCRLFFFLDWRKNLGDFVPCGQISEYREHIWDLTDRYFRENPKAFQEVSFWLRFFFRLKSKTQLGLLDKLALLSGRDIYFGHSPPVLSVLKNRVEFEG